MRKRNDDLGWTHTYTWPNTICHEWNEGGSGHDLLSMEAETGAITEGWGDFYSAALWNSKDDSDCEYSHSYLDYDRDGYLDAINNFSCLEGSSYEEAYCETATCMSTEYDWMRFWWYWHSDGGKTINDLMDLIIYSEPSNWMNNQVFEALTDSAEAHDYYMPYWIIVSYGLGLGD